MALRRYAPPPPPAGSDLSDANVARCGVGSAKKRAEAAAAGALYARAASEPCVRSCLAEKSSVTSRAQGNQTCPRLPGISPGWRGVAGPGTGTGDLLIGWLWAGPSGPPRGREDPLAKRRTEEHGFERGSSLRKDALGQPFVCLSVFAYRSALIGKHTDGISSPTGLP